MSRPLRRTRSASLEGRVVAITGAARGIGRATAAELCRAGARVAIGDLDAELARQAATELGSTSVGFEVDVSDRRAFGTFLDEAERALGPLDVLVNNAGIMMVGSFLEEDDEAAARVISVNLMGTIHGMRLAAKRMTGRGRGQIVNLASGASWVAPPHLATYAASKHAVRAISDSVRTELKGTGVQVTAVFPNVVDTDLAAGTGPARGSKLISPADVGQAIAAAIRTPRAEVFVPASLGLTLRLQAGLPTVARAQLMRLFGVDALYTRVDPKARVEYMQRLVPASGADELVARESPRDDAGHA